MALVLLVSACGQRAAPPERESSLRSQALVDGPLAWFETQQLSVEGVQQFGSAIAMSGEQAIIASRTTAAYAFRLTSEGWGQPQQLLAREAPLYDPEYGLSVAMSDTAAVVGCPDAGTAYVFVHDGAGWVPDGELLPGPDGSGYFGAAVAVEQNLVIVGSPGSQTASVFARTGDEWQLQKTLDPDDNGSGARGLSGFGAAIAISGDTLVVGAPLSGQLDGFDRGGAAHVFSVPSDLTGEWPQSKLVPKVRRGGELFGKAIALSGETLVIGAPRDWRYGPGTAYVFTGNGSDWNEKASLTSPDNIYGGDEFGTGVALSGDRVAIGAPQFQLGPKLYPGAAFTFVAVPQGGTAEQRVAGAVSADFSGRAVAISADSLLIGAPFAGSGGLVFVERLLGDAGSPCRAEADCGLGHCLSGVCCDSACPGECAECSTGVCLPVETGSPGTPLCAPYLCDGAGRSCPLRCITSDDCVSTHHCRDGECASKVEIGTACSGPEECLSGHCLDRHCSGTLPNGSPCEKASDCKLGNCVDGVCCVDRCLGQCEACDLLGHEGKCLPVVGAPHAERPPCAGTDTACAGSCDGEVTSSCVYPTLSTECDSSCRDGVEVVSSCDGRGECVSGKPRACGEFVCDGELACKSSCESDADCSDDLRCWSDGHCAPDVRCGADGVTSERAPDAQPRDCRPFVCDTTGECKTSCISSSDCAESNVCDAQQRCVPLPPSDAGCGCRVATSRRDPRSVAGAGSLAALMALLGRRSKSRRRRA